MARSPQAPAQAAVTRTWAAVGREWEDRWGKYLVNCAVWLIAVDTEMKNGINSAKHAYNPVEGARLWKASQNLVGREGDEIKD